MQQKAGKQGKDDSTAWLVSLEYRNVLEDMAHLVLPLQYVLQSTCSPSAVPERFTNVDACTVNVLLLLTSSQTNLLCSPVFTDDSYSENRAKGLKKACL